MNEEALQRSVADFLGHCVPDIYWSAVNPVPAKTKAAAGISKAMGMKAGVPDIIICWQGHFIGLELKTSTGSLSKTQKAAHEDIQAAGGTTWVCRSLDDVVGALKILGIPTRVAT